MKRRLIGFVREVWVELEMKGLLPSRVGRYRVVDLLQSREDCFAI